MEMKFKEGDIVWYYFVSLGQFEILAVWPKTKRYKVKETNVKYPYTHTVKEEKLYATRKEYFEEQLQRVNKRIEDLTKEKEEILQELK